jgi:hypothetical protein
MTTKTMGRSLAVVLLAVSVAGVSPGARAAARSRQATAGATKAAVAPPPYNEVSRLSEPVRKTMFMQVVTCRAEVDRMAGTLYPDVDPRAPGYSPQKDRKIFHERARYEDEGLLRCSTQAASAHALTRLELRSIMAEGSCKRWPPLTGKPSC